MKIAPGDHANKLFLAAIEELVVRLIPPSCQEQMDLGSLHDLLQSLPIVYCLPRENTFEITILCHSNYMNGVGRYFNDAICRWLVPGKNLDLFQTGSLSFSFEEFPHHSFYLDHVMVRAPSAQDFEIAERNAPKLLEEIRLNILAVYQARYIASLKSVSLEQKQFLIEENVSQILNLPIQDANRSPFDELHRFAMSVTGEEKIGQVKQTIALLLRARPKSFDRETFYEMTQFTILFKRQFASTRSARHVSRVIALHYLFKKMLQEATELTTHVKVCTGQRKRGLLSVVLAVNTSRAPDSLLLDAIRLCIPGVEAAADSLMIDRRDQKTSLFYIEVRKSAFSNEEIRTLRTTLPHHVIQLLENQQTFFPRNEEDLARNLITLSQQLHSMSSLPQIIIHYEKQTESHFFFSVLMSRLFFPTTKPLRELIGDLPHWSIDELRVIGKLKHKIPKEAACLRVTLDKHPFVRPDLCVDLLRARQKVATELTEIFGAYRDFNGGMILKQEEAISALRSSIGSMSAEADRLLESYFYSLRPGIMQTILPCEVLQAHFLQLQRLPLENYCEAQVNGFFVLFARVSDSSAKDLLDREVEALKFSTHELVSCFVMNSAGYILRTDDEVSIDALRKAVLHITECGCSGSHR